VPGLPEAHGGARREAECRQDAGVVALQDVQGLESLADVGIEVGDCLGCEWWTWEE